MTYNDDLFDVFDILYILPTLKYVSSGKMEESRVEET